MPAKGQVIHSHFRPLVFILLLENVISIRALQEQLIELHLILSKPVSKEKRLFLKEREGKRVLGLFIGSSERLVSTACDGAVRLLPPASDRALSRSVSLLPRTLVSLHISVLVISYYRQKRSGSEERCSSLYCRERIQAMKFQVKGCLLGWTISEPDWLSSRSACMAFLLALMQYGPK